MINIQLTGLTEASYRLELRSVTGQKFIERTFNATGYRHNEKLMRTASMTPGIYFLTIFGKNNHKITSNRVIVL
ncbi:T9SS type A sorting domain-containing protein [Niastella sp. OAS944]|uniref:T9SS type A sorting domain-containing protein n=1 Tax=Niastella sp. OAS944 TaxID=2664089 RepID=UPI0034739B56